MLPQLLFPRFCVGFSLALLPQWRPPGSRVKRSHGQSQPAVDSPNTSARFPGSRLWEVAPTPYTQLPQALKGERCPRPPRTLGAESALRRTSPQHLLQIKWCSGSGPGPLICRLCDREEVNEAPGTTCGFLLHQIAASDLTCLRTAKEFKWDNLCLVFRTDLST